MPESSRAGDIQSRVQRDAFRYFERMVNPANGLVADNTRPASNASIAAIGFALSCYTVGVERGFMPRAEAADRTLAALRFFRDSPQGEAPDTSGYRGFYYHFLDMQSGRRAWRSEISLVDTAILIAGMLTVGQYFDADSESEAEIRDLAETLYARADWNWALNDGPTIRHGWKPECGFLHYGWEGYSEAILLYVLALGSPTFSLAEDHFLGYAARGVPYGPDDGTLAPAAAAASLPFAPEIVLPTLEHLYEAVPAAATELGFRCFNPSFQDEQGERRGWTSGASFAVDQGPVVMMIENHRSGFLWELLRRNGYVARGLRRAGFRGGWL